MMAMMRAQAARIALARIAIGESAKKVILATMIAADGIVM